MQFEINKAVVIAIATYLIILSTVFLEPVYAGGKGLKVNLFINNVLTTQNAVIETWQDGRFVQSDTWNIQYTNVGGLLNYPRGAIESGPFQICVTLQYDNIQSCGNGYNSEEKRPETVSISFSSAPSPAPDTNGGGSAQSQSQSQTTIICPANAKCIIER
jgi:hypothetical protein